MSACFSTPRKPGSMAKLVSSSFSPRYSFTFLLRASSANKRFIGAHQTQLVLVDPFELHAAVTRNRLRDVGRDVLRNRKLGVHWSTTEDFVGGEAGGGGVPQRQVRDAVRVNVLGAFSSSAKGASASRASAYFGLSTSTSNERSDWTISGLVGSNVSVRTCRAFWSSQSSAAYSPSFLGVESLKSLFRGEHPMLSGRTGREQGEVIRTGDFLHISLFTLPRGPPPSLPRELDASAFTSQNHHITQNRSSREAVVTQHAKKLIVPILKYVVGFVVLAVVIYGYWETKTLTKIDPNTGLEIKTVRPGLSELLQKPIAFEWLGATVLLIAVAACLQITRWYLLVRALDLPFTLRNAFRFSLVGLFYNTFIPGSVGGDLVKALLHRPRTPSEKRKPSRPWSPTAQWGYSASSCSSRYSAPSPGHLATNASTRTPICNGSCKLMAGIASGTVIGFLLLGLLPQRRVDRFLRTVEVNSQSRELDFRNCGARSGCTGSG